MKKAPLEQKDYLNPKEAIRLYGLSRRKFRALLCSEPQTFVMMYGARRLIIRSEFERYLRQPGRKEALTNGEVGGRKKKGLEA